VASSRGAIEDALDVWVRPRLYVHGGDVEVRAVEDGGRVHLRLLGACDGCLLRPVTVAITVGPALAEVEGLSEVHVEGMAVSQDLLASVRERLAKRRER
jgi:Fe-S cluster biogenesis protein NfuA